MGGGDNIIYTHMLQQTTLVHMYIAEFGRKRDLLQTELADSCCSIA